MIMDIASFAVGFALGHRGGGGGYRDRVFHDIIDNIKELVTLTISDHHTWKIGMWTHLENTTMGTMTYSDLTGYFSSGLSYMFANSDSQDRYMLMPVMCWYFNLVGIIYKDGVPIYATVIAPSGMYSDSTSSVSDGGLYFTKKEYRLDSVTYVSNTLAPDRWSHYYYTGSISGSYTYSWHSYSYDSSTGSIVDDGRVSSTNSLPYVSTFYPFPHDNSSFSDLEFEDLHCEYQYLAEEMYKYQGYSVRPLVILN